MVIDVHRKRRTRADETGRTWEVGSYRKDRVCGNRYRCFLNGVEVTRRTFYCDSRRGIVRMYRLNADGKKYLNDDREIATEERRGHVKLIRREAAA